MWSTTWAAATGGSSSPRPRNAAPAASASTSIRRRIKQCQLNAINNKVSDRVRFELTSVFRARDLRRHRRRALSPALDERPASPEAAGGAAARHADRRASVPHRRLAGGPHRAHRRTGPRRLSLDRAGEGRAADGKCSLRTADGVLRRGRIEWEQEFQTIIGSAVLDDRELIIEAATLRGDRIHISHR